MLRVPPHDGVTLLDLCLEQGRDSQKIVAQTLR
jgi:hypothetical protein